MNVMSNIGRLKIEWKPCWDFQQLFDSNLFYRFLEDLLLISSIVNYKDISSTLKKLSKWLPVNKQEEQKLRKLRLSENFHKNCVDFIWKFAFKDINWDIDEQVTDKFKKNFKDENGNVSFELLWEYIEKLLDRSVALHLFNIYIWDKILVLLRDDYKNEGFIAKKMWREFVLVTYNWKKFVYHIQDNRLLSDEEAIGVIKSHELYDIWANQIWVGGLERNQGWNQGWVGGLESANGWNYGWVGRLERNQAWNQNWVGGLEGANGWNYYNDWSLNPKWNQEGQDDFTWLDADNIERIIVIRFFNEHVKPYLKNFLEKGKVIPKCIRKDSNKIDILRYWKFLWIGNQNTVIVIRNNRYSNIIKTYILDNDTGKIILERWDMDDLSLDIIRWWMEEWYRQESWSHRGNREKDIESMIKRIREKRFSRFSTNWNGQSTDNDKWKQKPKALGVTKTIPLERFDFEPIGTADDQAFNLGLDNEDLWDDDLDFDNYLSIRNLFWRFSTMNFKFSKKKQTTYEFKDRIRLDKFKYRTMFIEDENIISCLIIENNTYNIGSKNKFRELIKAKNWKVIFLLWDYRYSVELIRLLWTNNRWENHIEFKIINSWPYKSLLDNNDISDQFSSYEYDELKTQFLSVSLGFNSQEIKNIKKILISRLDYNKWSNDDFANKLKIRNFLNEWGTDIFPNYVKFIEFYNNFLNPENFLYWQKLVWIFSDIFMRWLFLIDNIVKFHNIIRWNHENINWINDLSKVWIKICSYINYISQFKSSWWEESWQYDIFGNLTQNQFIWLDNLLVDIDLKSIIEHILDFDPFWKFNYLIISLLKFNDLFWLIGYVWFEWNLSLKNISKEKYDELINLIKELIDNFDIYLNEKDKDSLTEWWTKLYRSVNWILNQKKHNIHAQLPIIDYINMLTEEEKQKKIKNYKHKLKKRMSSVSNYERITWLLDIYIKGATPEYSFFAKREDIVETWPQTNIHENTYTDTNRTFHLKHIETTTDWSVVKDIPPFEKIDWKNLVFKWDLVWRKLWTDRHTSAGSIGWTDNHDSTQFVGWTEPSMEKNLQNIKKILKKENELTKYYACEKSEDENVPYLKSELTESYIRAHPEMILTQADIDILFEWSSWKLTESDDPDLSTDIPD